ncbi:hypothetical protein ACQP1W_37170 [Spirillospora sp. CA-255316]
MPDRTTMTTGATAAFPHAIRPGTGKARVLVRYERSGGSAGVRESITVDDDGRTVVTAAKTTEFSLTTDEYTGLLAALEGVTTTGSSTSGCDVPDHVTYALAFRNWRATRCHRLPADWRPAVARLDELIERSAW